MAATSFLLELLFERLVEWLRCVSLVVSIHCNVYKNVEVLLV
jgi:hypothetical protein